MPVTSKFPPPVPITVTFPKVPVPVPVPVRLNRHPRCRYRHLSQRCRCRCRCRSDSTGTQGAGAGNRHRHRFFDFSSQMSIFVYDFMIFFLIAHALPFFLACPLCRFLKIGNISVSIFFLISTLFLISTVLINTLKASSGIRSKYFECSVLFVTRTVSGFYFRSSKSKLRFFYHDFIVFFPPVLAWAGMSTSYGIKAYFA